MLDALHESGIEIVSPNFMNQRQLTVDDKVIPQRRYYPPSRDDKTGRAEEVLFSKAELASSVEQIQDKLKALKKSLNDEAEEGKPGVDRDAVKAEMAKLTEELEIARELAKQEAAKDRARSDEEQASGDSAAVEAAPVETASDEEAIPNVPAVEARAKDNNNT